MGEVVIKVKDEKGAEVEQKLDDAAVGKIVGEKAELQTKLAAAHGETAKLKVVQDFAAKYSLAPEELVANADGAFTLVSKLIEEGVIDAQGKVLVQKSGVKPKEGTPAEGGDIDLAALLKGDTKGLTGEAKTMAMMAKALEPMFGKIAKTLDEVTTVQTGMLRDRWEAKIQKDYPNLTTDDVKKVFSEAAQKPKLGILEVAKGVSEAKSKTSAELRAEHAKEFGVNLEEFDANKLKEPDSKGGAAAMAGGAKFTLSKRRMGKDFVDPAAATKNYFKKLGILR